MDLVELPNQIQQFRPAEAINSTTVNERFLDMAIIFMVWLNMVFVLCYMFQYRRRRSLRTNPIQGYPLFPPITLRPARLRR